MFEKYNNENEGFLMLVSVSVYNTVKTMIW